MLREYPVPMFIVIRIDFCRACLHHDPKRFRSVLSCGTRYGVTPRVFSQTFVTVVIETIVIIYGTWHKVIVVGVGFRFLIFFFFLRQKPFINGFNKKARILLLLWSPSSMLSHSFLIHAPHGIPSKTKR